MKISQRAFDMTVREEVSSKAYYIKHYLRPEWPGLSSGVTVGIGYDLGQASRDKIRNDWNKHVTPDMLMVMMSCSGLTGQAGKQKLAEVKNKILIPWDAALAVFAERDVPSWTAAVIRAVPGADKLPPSCLGALFDTAYNRGNSWSAQGDRYKEMRAIKGAVAVGNLAAVPQEFTRMKRLWPNTKGLLLRCDHRVALWQQGLKERTDGAPANDNEASGVGPTPSIPDPEVPLDEGSARTKPSATSTGQNTTTGTIVVAGGAAAQQAHHYGLISTELAIFIGFIGVLAAFTTWIMWYRSRNPS